MCGRVIVDYDEMMSVAGDTALAAWMTGAPAGAHSSWNIAPTGQVPVAAIDPRTGERHFETAYWSLVPPWAKQLSSKYPTFNARSETAASKPTFRAAVQHARCAIPVTGFYEWSGPAKARVPHAIFGPSGVLALAGLYSWWRAPGAEEEEPWRLTATILTAPATGRMREVHDRMPVFLSEARTPDWLAPGTIGDQALLDAVASGAAPISEQLRVHRVRPLRGDGPQLIDPAPEQGSGHAGSDLPTEGGAS
ncbi:SOS response-associated peptidase [Leucobacter sp. HY1910]